MKKFTHVWCERFQCLLYFCTCYIDKVRLTLLLICLSLAHHHYFVVGTPYQLFGHCMLASRRYLIFFSNENTLSGIDSWLWVDDFLAQRPLYCLYLVCHDASIRVIVKVCYLIIYGARFHCLPENCQKCIELLKNVTTPATASALLYF